MADIGSISTVDSLLLEKTNRIREQIVDDLIVDGLPKTEEDRSFLMESLNGLDRQIISKARIKNDEKSNNTASLISQILLKTSRTVMSNTHTTIPELPSELELSEIVPGAMDIGVINLSQDEIS
jgi:hypothetical protein